MSSIAIQDGEVVWSSDDDSSGPCDPSAPEGSHIYVRADSGYEAQLQASNERVKELQAELDSLDRGYVDE